MGPVLFECDKVHNRVYKHTAYKSITYQLNVKYNSINAINIVTENALNQ